MSSAEGAPMKPGTDKRRQWGWFIGLWCAGLAAVAAVSYGLRWLIFV